MKLDITPVAKPRMTRSDRWRKRPAVEKYWRFKDELHSMIRGTLEPRLDLVFYIPMPESWSEKKKVIHDGKPHQQKPDLDNLIKAWGDSMCDDDSYIYEIHAKKLWARKGGIEVDESGN